MSNNDNWALYNSIDSAVTLHIHDDIKDDIVKQSYEKIYRQTMDLYPAVVFMMTTGLLIDKDRLKIEHKRVEELQVNAQLELDKLSGGLNALSPKQCIAYFYGTLGQAVLTGGTGKPTTDDKAMARLARKGIREAKLAQEIRGYNKLKSTYLEVETDSDGRVRTSYNLRGTREGRLSSSQNIFGTGMNLQNLHPVFKGFIVPNPGHAFIELDKRQSEWVITAYASGDGNMIAAVESGEDVHAATAHMMTGIPRELIEREAELLKHHTDQDLILAARSEFLPEILDIQGFLPRSMTCRQAGKKSNHGLNYIMKFRRFALENEIPEPEAKLMVEAYLDGYPGLRPWWKRIEGMLSRDRTLVNCFGRPRRFLDAWGDDLIKAGVAFIPQSTNADLVNRAIIATYNDRADFLEPNIMSAQVHDSILNQYPVDDWTSCAAAMMRERDHLNPVMEYSGREFQIETDLKFGMNWGEHHERDNPIGMVESIPIGDNITELADRMSEQYKEFMKAA